MIVITGALGFIGSNIVSSLNTKGKEDLVFVDDFSKDVKFPNIEGKKYLEKVERDSFFAWLEQNSPLVDFIIHIGARTDTAEFNEEVFNELNVNYSKEVWHYCVRERIPLIYASSAATYGMGEYGYEDSHDIVNQLKPLNPYGESKNEFDKWVLNQMDLPPFWAGLKFFNVYGPNEYHKGRMASVIFQAFNQIGKTNAMKLFRSHHPDFKDGMQLRDFVYVKDVVNVIDYLMQHQDKSGLYNVGTGQARSFLDLVKNTFKAMGIKEDISFIDTPEDIRDKYQYFTEADMNKLRSIGYNQDFTTLEEGVQEYVGEFLMKNKFN